VGRRRNKNKNKKNRSKGRAAVVNIRTAKNPKPPVEELEESLGSRPMKLRFSPTAWAKFLYMRDVGNTEVGGFAVTMPDDLLYVKDFVLPKQECGYASVDFDDESVADLVDDMIDEGLKPAQFLRIWIHTHPSMSASPSTTDEKTFARVFGKCDWAIMAIISTNGDQYCELRVNGGPLPGSFQIPIEVDYESYNFPASNSEEWAAEYNEKVEKVQYTYAGGGNWHSYGSAGAHGDWNGFPEYSRTIAHFRGKDTEPIGFEFDEDDDNLVVVDGFDDEEDRNIIPVKTPLSIPNEILKHISPNQMSLLEDMSEHERQYIYDDIRERFKIGD
jgi:hypothetical protein